MARRQDDAQEAMTDATTKLVDLGPAGITYVKTKLEAGDALAHELLKLPLDRGSTTAYLPAMVDVGSLDLDFGGLGAYSDLSYWEPVYRLVLDFLHESRDHVIIFENLCQRVEEPLPRERHLTYFSYYPSSHRIWTDLSNTGIEAKGVCSVLFSEFANADTIRSAFKQARRYPLIGALTSRPVKGPLFQDAQIDANMLHELGSRARYILVGAYDEEAVLVWTRAR